MSYKTQRKFGNAGVEATFTKLNLRKENWLKMEMSGGPLSIFSSHNLRRIGVRIKTITV